MKQEAPLGNDCSPESHYKSMGDILDAQGQLLLLCPIWLKFKLIQDIMHVIIICKLKRAANSILSRKIWPKLELIQALMYVLVTCKRYKDHPETGVKMYRHHHSHYKAMGLFFRLSRVDNSVVQLGPN